MAFSNLKMCLFFYFGACITIKKKSPIKTNGDLKNALKGTMFVLKSAIVDKKAAIVWKIA